LNIVQIDGPDAALTTIRSRPDVVPLNGTRLESGDGRLWAYVPTAALPEIEALGVTVTTIKSEAERETDLGTLYALIDQDEPPIA
jgi:hypothetical protein